jgi:hypothetical protein
MPRDIPAAFTTASLFDCAGREIVRGRVVNRTLYIHTKAGLPEGIYIVKAVSAK